MKNTGEPLGDGKKPPLGRPRKGKDRRLQIGVYIALPLSTNPISTMPKPSRYIFESKL
jgi:hypothetical protein